MLSHAKQVDLLSVGVGVQSIDTVSGIVFIGSSIAMIMITHTRRLADAGVAAIVVFDEGRGPSAIGLDRVRPQAH